MLRWLAGLDSPRAGEGKPFQAQCGGGLREDKNMGVLAALTGNAAEITPAEGTELALTDGSSSITLRIVVTGDDQISLKERPIHAGVDEDAAVSKPDSVPDLLAYDADWHERIERAKRAREEGKKARQGKPATFQTHRTLT